VTRFGLAACLALAAVGCHKKPPPPVPPPEIVEVRVVDRGDGELPVDLSALTAAAGDAIAQSSGLPLRLDGGAAAPDPRQHRYRLRVEVRLDGAEEPSTKKGIMRAFVLARLQPVGADVGALSFEQQAVAERIYTIGKAGEPAWAAHAARAVKDVVAGVGARVRLSAGDAQAIVAALDGSDEDLRDEAMRLAGERREKAAVPSLIKRLKSDDHAVRDHAIGALAAIGDQRAVRPLTEVARFRDLTDLPKVLDALATIGGPEARAYLQFVADGHDSQEMRDLAKQALTHLERRAPHDLAEPAR
jgi:hypothetical protein